MRVIRSNVTFIEKGNKIIAKLNGKTVGFIEKNRSGGYTYAFGSPSQNSYIGFDVDDLETAKSRIEENVFVGSSRRTIKSKNNITDINYYECPKCHEPQLYHGKNGIVCYNCGTKVSEDDLDKLKIWVSPHSKIKSSRRPIKSAFYVTCCDENDNDVGFVTEDKKVTENESKIKYFDSKKEAENFAKLMYDVYKEENEKYNFGYEFYVEEEPIESSRRPVKSGYEGDDAEAEELALYIKNTSELYHGITKSIIENLKKKARKGAYDKERAVDAWMYAADAGAKMYDKEFGSGRGSLTMFSKSSRRKAAEELARYYEENVLEGLDNVQSAFKIVSGKHTVEYSKPSREELEKVLDDFLAQKKVKFTTDIYDDTVDYILTFWDEQDFKPRSVEDAVTDWYNDTKKHFPEDLKKISAAYHRWIKSKLIRSSRRMRTR